MNALVAHYHATNEAEGHDRNCAWGAGGDCNCKAFYRGAVARFRRLLDRRNDLDKMVPSLGVKAMFAACIDRHLPALRESLPDEDPAFDNPWNTRAHLGDLLCERLEELLRRIEDRIEDWRTDADPSF